jgi:serpin B
MQFEYPVNYLQLIRRYDSNHSRLNATVEFASRMFLADHFAIKPDFRLLMQSFYSTDVLNMNFSKSAQAARNINNWVNKTTHGKISKLLGPQDVNDRTSMIIVNAIYFKANWKYPFNKEQTR